MVSFLLALLIAAPNLPVAGGIADPLAAEREAVWNCPEMLQARGYLADYFAASKRHSDLDAQRYFERLSQTTPDQMRQWLVDLQRRRSSNLAHYQRREFKRFLAEQVQQSVRPRVEEVPTTTVAVAPLTLPPKHFSQETAPRKYRQGDEIDSDQKGAELDYQEYLRTQCEKFHALGLPCPKTVEELVRGPVVETTPPAEAVSTP